MGINIDEKRKYCHLTVSRCHPIKSKQNADVVQETEARDFTGILSWEILAKAVNDLLTLLF